MALDNFKRNLDWVFETPKKATLVWPNWERVAVEVNSPQAKNYFSKWYTLETKPQVSPATVVSWSWQWLPPWSVDTTQDNPMMSAYNSLLMDSLKKAQWVDTVELLKRQRELQRKAINVRTEADPTWFETISPSQRNQIRQSNAQVIEADIDENAYQLAKAEKAIANFEDIFFKAQQFGQDFAEKMVLPDSMIENYKKIIEADPEKMTTILSTLNDKSKQAVIGSLDYTKLGQKTDLSKRNVQVMWEYTDPTTWESKKRYGYFDESWNIVYTDQWAPTGILEITTQIEWKTKEFNDWITSFNGTVTQDFTTPVSYFADWRTTHNAYDIAGKIGQAITSPVSGTVVSVTNADDGSGWWNSLLLKDDAWNTWRMSHFQALAVRPWDTVKAGSQAVGYLGNTGYVLKWDWTKPTKEQLEQGAWTHLHIEAKDSQGNFIDISKPTTQWTWTLTNAQQLAQTIFNWTGTLSGISTKNNLRGNVSIELEKLKQDALKSGDILWVMRASAGGQNISDTALQSLEKAVNVIGQLSDLQKSIDKQVTGPIVWIIRSNNPYDTKAQLIKAQLTAIIPNLARGIYWEVGVLTDNDVALYAKTLPNLKSTEDVSKLVLAATIRSVQRSIENKMLLQAGGNRDVSWYVNDYLRIKKQADEIEMAITGWSDLKSKVASLGYDYDAMKADGLDDEEIKKALNIQ